MRIAIERFIQDQTASGDVSRVSVYFRDLQDGPTMGIGENEFFVPASLLKTPLLITYLRLAEDTPALLATRLVFEGSALMGQEIAPQETIAPGTPYTVEELLRRMIAYSDNRSYYVLLDYLHQKFDRRDELLQTLHDLGIIDPSSDIEDSVTVRGYASIFRMLYNVSYLSQNDSELALQFLSASDWKDGVVAGVPKGINAAHKFGERTDPNGTRQLHDCGIIYYPKNPYLLCVMTRGKDYTALSSVIAEISRMVYQEVNGRRMP